MVVEHTHLFNGSLSRTTRVSRYQKGKTNLDLTEARFNEWQWHQLGHVQVCTSLQTENHASTPPLSFLQAGCPFCRPTNSAKALKAMVVVIIVHLHVLFGSRICVVCDDNCFRLDLEMKLNAYNDYFASISQQQVIARNVSDI